VGLASPILNLIGQIIVSVTIDVATYLSNGEVEVNLSGSHVELLTLDFGTFKEMIDDRWASTR
jgi:hypothetical protein